jgi:endo-1,4-beta-D-glucanase Y
MDKMFVKVLSLQGIINGTWNGIKRNNINAYQVHCVHRPFAETPDDCVSEGIGYGMLSSIYLNDQFTFDTLFDTANNFMWNGYNYEWHIGEYGNIMDRGAATDAEEDIAMSLIFANSLVKTGKWKTHTNPTYAERAQQILDNMWNSRMITPEGNVAPGAGWGGNDFVNPSYFAPAWYKLFKKFDSSNHNWDLVIDKSYETLLNNVGFQNGLVPDWCSPSGDFYEGSFGYNTYGNGKYFFKDAIRTLWRISTDYLWNNDPRAKQFLENSYSFITKKGGAKASNFYQMNGELVPKEDIWYFDNNKKHRTRREHSYLTVGMWSTVAYALNYNTTEYSTELLNVYNNPEDQPNEMYFEQFLGLFGALMLRDKWTPIN